MKRFLLALAADLGALRSAGAAQAKTPRPTRRPPEKKDKEEDAVKRRERSWSSPPPRSRSTLINAPATISVVAADTIASSPAQNFGDLLRSTPGINVIQISARDINMTSRQRTSTLANSQLVLLDGRSIYLDFFGLVLWDFVPRTRREIKQIEVVRGPASAVWGANALTGVVNIITKIAAGGRGLQPEPQGGLFNRDEGSREDDGSGYLYGANFSFAQAPNDKLAWRLSAGYFNSDPFSRPTGTRAPDCHPGRHPLRDSAARSRGIPAGGAPIRRTGPGVGSFPNAGTSQPKVDLRVDQEFHGAAAAASPIQGGYAGTTGIIHTGLGPFDIQSGSYMAYGKSVDAQGRPEGWPPSATSWTSSAPNLLSSTRTPDPRQPVQLNFKTQTYDFEIGHSNVLGGKHILSYGGNAAATTSTSLIAPEAEDRNEFGAYFQEEFFVDKFRVAVGRARGQVREPRRRGLLAPRQRHVQADARPFDPRAPSTGPSARPR